MKKAMTLFMGTFLLLLLSSAIKVNKATQDIALPNPTETITPFDNSRKDQALRDAEYLIEKGGAKLEKLTQEIALESDKVEAATNRTNASFLNKDIKESEKNRRLAQIKTAKNFVQQKKEQLSILKSRLTSLQIDLEN